MRSSGYAQFGSVITRDGETRGIGGGKLILNTASGQGSYRNYLTKVKFYGLTLICMAASTEFSNSVSLVDVDVFTPASTHIYALALYDQGLRWGASPITGIACVKSRNITMLCYFVHKMWNTTTLELEEPPLYTVESLANDAVGNYAIYLDYHGDRNSVVYYAKAKSLANSYAQIYSDASGNTLVDCIGVVNKAVSADARLSVGYTIKIKVQDVNGNAIQNAQVSIWDKNAKVSSFRRILNAAGNALIQCTDNLLYGLNWGVALTTLNFDDGTNLAINDVIRYDGEQMLITGKPGANQITVTRGYNGTSCVHHSNLAAERRAWEKATINIVSDINGNVPRMILFHRQYRATADYDTFSPFRIRVKKIGYEPYEDYLTLTERSSKTITLQPSRMKFR